ncbi:MAG TPA: PhoH family protein [Candidatus Elarobacter sp.]|jgi:phosphate starvation-inducible PhoH-like protein
MPSITSEATFDLSGLSDPIRLCGYRDQNLNALEALIPVVLRLDGDRVYVSGDQRAVRRAEDVLTAMLTAARKGAQITPDDVALAARASGERGIPPTLATTARGREVRPKTDGQRALVGAIDANTLTFAVGPAGTGKTFLAIVMAVRALKNREVSRIVLSRPAVEAGEKLGFLPGDFKEKVDPDLRPLYDALQELLENGTTEKYIERGTIEVAPLAYMRGRTLGDAFVILDEAQNATHEQLKMFLTRLGQNSKMVVTGDDTQIDLPRGMRSGILDVERLFSDIDDLAIVRLDENDVVRHPLVGRLVAAYDRLSREREA